MSANVGLNKPTSNGWKSSLRLPTTITTALFLYRYFFLPFAKTKFIEAQTSNWRKFRKHCVKFTYLPLCFERAFVCTVFAGCYRDSHSGEEQPSESCSRGDIRWPGPAGYRLLSHTEGTYFYHNVVAFNFESQKDAFWLVEIWLYRSE